MAYQSMRDWMARLEAEGLLKRITTEVDWNLELGAITRRVADQERGPAALFERISRAIARLRVAGSLPEV